MQVLTILILIFAKVVSPVWAQGFVSLCTPDSGGLETVTLHSVAVISELKGGGCEMYALGQIELRKEDCKTKVNSDGSRTLKCNYLVTNLAFLNYLKTMDSTKIFISRKIAPGQQIRATIDEAVDSKVPTFNVTVEPIKTSLANCPNFTADAHNNDPGYEKELEGEDFVAKVENALKKFVQAELGRALENLCCLQQANAPPPGPIGK